MTTLPVLTYTFLSNFEQCPHKAYRRYVLKDIKFKSTEAMEKGKKDHKAFEDRLTKGIALDSHLRSAEPYCAIFDVLPDTVPMRVEYYLGIRVDGSPCDPNAQAVWMRGKADLATWSPQGGWLVDWKTGKPWEDPFELNCQALLCAAHHNEVPFWKGEYFWLQNKQPGKRYDLDPMQTFSRIAESWGRMHGYINAGAWPKTPNKLCNWCDVLDCEHNPKRTK